MSKRFFRNIMYLALFTFFSQLLFPVASVLASGETIDASSTEVVNPTLAAPTNFSYTITNDNDVTLKWDPVSLATYYTLYQVIDGNKISVMSVTATSTTLNNLPDGDYHYIVQAKSFRYGTSPEGSSLTFTISKWIIDTEVPVTTIHGPEGWRTESALVTLTATDNETGVANTYYSVNGSEFVAGTTFTLVEEGIHVVSFYSVDKAGNEEEIQTAEIKIDKTAPDASWDFNDVYELGTVLDLNYTAIDGLSGVYSETLLVNGVQFDNGSQLNLDKPGEYHLQLTVVDNVGWVTIIEKTITVYIPVEIKVNPEIINHNNGKFTVEVSFSKQNEVEYRFDLDTVSLNGVKAINETIGDQERALNGIFKFNREDFNWVEGEILLQFNGMLDGYLLVGSATIEVIK